MRIQYTLLSDGSSDRALLFVLDWLLARLSSRAFEPQWADLRRLRAVPATLEGRIIEALRHYPCDLLFVHRDAEKDSRERRVAEVDRALATLTATPRAVAVIPVRMTEAWLLFDEVAIRGAAGNPNGSVALDLPSLRSVETLPDPKGVLHDRLRRASELGGRRSRKFNVDAAVHRVAQLVEDFSPLLALEAFAALERDLGALLRRQGWA